MAAGLPPGPAAAGARQPAWPSWGLLGRRAGPASCAPPSAASPACAIVRSGRAAQSREEPRAAHSRCCVCRSAARPPWVPRSPSAARSSSSPALKTGQRKARKRRNSYLCRLMRNTARRRRAPPLPAYTSWDGPHKLNVRHISRRSLCTGKKEGALLTTCIRLHLKKPWLHLK